MGSGQAFCKCEGLPLVEVVCGGFLVEILVDTASRNPVVALDAAFESMWIDANSSSESGQLSGHQKGNQPSHSARASYRADRHSSPLGSTAALAD
jgi:hypothetical protein